MSWTWEKYVLVKPWHLGEVDSLDSCGSKSPFAWAGLCVQESLWFYLSHGEQYLGFYSELSTLRYIGLEDPGALGSCTDNLTESWQHISHSPRISQRCQGRTGRRLHSFSSRFYGYYGPLLPLSVLSRGVSRSHSTGCWRSVAWKIVLCPPTPI